MLTLNRFGLSNFRVFKEYTEFEFAPITVLTGANNSGKSSLLKALLLIQDNAKRNGLKELEFDGGEHNLGSWEFTKNKFSDSEVMEFGIGFKIVPDEYGWNSEFLGEYIKEFRNKLTFGNTEIHKKSLLNTTLSIQLIDKKVENAVDFMKELILLLIKKKETSGNIEYAINMFLEGLINLKFENNALPIIFDEITFQNSFDEETPYPILFHDFINEVLTPRMWKYLHINDNPSYDSDGDYYDYEYFHYNMTLEKLLEYCKDYNKEKYDSMLNKVYKIWDSYSNSKDSVEIRLLDVSIGQYLNHNNLLLLDFFYTIKINFIYKNTLNTNAHNYELLAHLNFEYLGVSRGKQERAYQHSKKDSALADLLVQFLKSNFAQDSKAQVFMNKWLNNFGLAEKVIFQPIMKDVYTSIVFYKNGIELNISDLGFGITQLLPLLLKIVMCEKQMLLLEEPETNLHPTLQSRLAELFVDAYRTFDIQFIIETHSEYLIRRLQVLTAKYEEAKRKEQATNAFISPEESVIYYFYEPDKVPKGKKQVEKINIMVDGRLDNGFGDGFVDEATRQQFDLVMLTTQLNENQAEYKTTIAK